MTVDERMGPDTHAQQVLLTAARNMTPHSTLRNGWVCHLNKYNDQGI